MNLTIYSHNKPDTTIEKTVIERLENKLEKIDFIFFNRCAGDLRSKILDELITLGWSNKVRISSGRAITVTAKNGKIALCLQTGNMARFYADILKLQALYLDDKI